MFSADLHHGDLVETGGYPDKTSENMGWSSRCDRAGSRGETEEGGETAPTTLARRAFPMMRLTRR
ncbi:hypothetical protein [Actinoallomurus sp. NPDC050550]|uniref:hypothetical protein n=1 Tax=Actinoallomurus sp. NPDC050550 TaxID=3154937 RepID=UPI0033BFDE7D